MSSGAVFEGSAAVICAQNEVEILAGPLPAVRLCHTSV